MISIPRASRHHNWTWVYIIAFALVACASYTIEKEIEFNQLPLPVDYN